MAIGTITWDSGDNAVTVSGTGSTARDIGITAAGVTSGRYYVFSFLAKGSETVIRSSVKILASSTSARGFWSSVTDTQFLTGLNGATRSGTADIKALYYVKITEWVGDPDSGGALQSTKNSTDGICTITPRATAGTCTDFDLDNASDTVIATWTRPSTHTGWRIKIVFTVNGTTCITRTGHISTMSAYTPTGPITSSGTELYNMNAAMNNVSPGTIRATIYTGWVFSAGTSYVATGVNTSTNSIIRSFVGHVWVKVTGVMSKCEVFVKAPTFTRQHAYVRDAGVWKESK